MTDDEIYFAYQKLWPFHPAEEPKLAKDITVFARAIIAAYIAKLRQGVELPEPRGKVAHEERPYEPAWISSEDAYDIGQLQQYGDARDAAGYLRGLEDAKRVCMGIAMAPSNVILGVAVSCADAIEQLEGKL